MTSITKSESELSPSPACMSRVESESYWAGLESESNKIGTRVRLQSESKDSCPN